MQPPNIKKGLLEVICGSMFSGKSEELIRRLKRATFAQKNVLVFKHTFDQRISFDTTITHEYVASHNGNKLVAHAIDTPETILNYLQPTTDVIGIDEAQFFSSDLLPVIFYLLDIGKSVLVAGLNIDFRGVPFGTIPHLMAVADTVTKLSAICVMCGDEAFFSQRLVNGKPARYDDPIIQVGAQEAYQARCRSCFTIDKKASWEKTL